MGTEGMKYSLVSLFEAMGMSLPYSSTMAAEDAEKADSAAQSAEVLAQAIRRQILPRPPHPPSVREWHRRVDGGGRHPQVMKMLLAHGLFGDAISVAGQTL